MIVSVVQYAGVPTAIVCDGRCEKAWGLSSRPMLSGEYLRDDELGEAPIDPGTYEGECGKPTDRKHNKWCARECERHRLVRECEEFELSRFGEASQ
jgi:hypothetical protein